MVSHQSSSCMPESDLVAGLGFFLMNKQNAYLVTEFLLCLSSSNLRHTSVGSLKAEQSCLKGKLLCVEKFTTNSRNYPCS